MLEADAKRVEGTVFANCAYLTTYTMPTLMKVDGNSAAVLFEDHYMLMENRKIQSGKDVTKSLMLKVDLGGVSCITTDLDHLSKFDNELPKDQTRYKIRIYGPVKSVDRSKALLPQQKLGIDFFHRKYADYKITVKQIEFPVRYAE